MRENDDQNISSFLGHSQIHSTNSDGQPFITNQSTINRLEKYHYLCQNCLGFPFIEFFKDMKYIKFTCFCLNHQKILIKDLFNGTNNIIFIDKSNSNDFIIGCQRHNKKFEFVCKHCLQHTCSDCIKLECKNHMIKLKDFRFDNKK